MSGCDAEMCPFWGGDGCVCDVLGIDEDERKSQVRSLQREGFYPIDADDDEFWEVGR